MENNNAELPSNNTALVIMKKSKNSFRLLTILESQSVRARFSMAHAGLTQNNVIIFMYRSNRCSSYYVGKYVYTPHRYI